MFKESWDCFRKNLIPLLKATAPYVMAVMLLEVILAQSFINIGSFLSFSTSVVSMILKAFIVLVGLGYLYKQEGIGLEITARKVMIYIFSSVYISVATILGLMFFVVPGLIIKAITFLMPIYVLRGDQGPIESVASSTSLLKEYIIQITLFWLAVWAAIVAVRYLLEFILSFLPGSTIVISCMAEFMSILASLFTLPVMISIYTYLTDRDNHQLQSTVDVTAE